MVSMSSVQVHLITGRSLRRPSASATPSGNEAVMPTMVSSRVSSRPPHIDVETSGSARDPPKPRKTIKITGAATSQPISVQRRTARSRLPSVPMIQPLTNKAVPRTSGMAMRSKKGAICRLMNSAKERVPSKR